MGLTAGTILGQYEIRSPLGAGGMGEVYRAHDTRLDRDVAIKVLPDYLTSNPERLRRFEQEARVTATLNHPNILAVYQMATDNGVSYLVEELLEGETLRERLRRGPAPLRKAIDYAVQIVHGLAAAHDKGIVHRDLKPENLFLTKDGRLKILDFGLARLVPSREASGQEATVTQKTDPGAVLGTAGYMSPEQVRGKTVDHRTDIFAFGTILYEMMTGKQPFRKATSAETMTAILNEEPPSISLISANTPPGLQRIVQRCLEKNPEQRFQSTSDLAFALDALSDFNTSSSTSISTPQSRSHIRFITLAAVAGVIIVGVIAWRIYASGHGKHSGLPPKLLPLISSPGFKSSPAFSPDGNEVAFTWKGDNPTDKGAYHIYVQLVGAGVPLRLTNASDSDYFPTWSPDGRFIAFLRGRHPGAYYVVPALGGPERKLADAYLGSSIGQEGGISWSPDGKYLAVADAGENANRDSANRIFYISAESGERIDSQIEPPGPFIARPSFSPDGKDLAFIGGPGFLSNDVYLAAVSGGKPRAITSLHSSMDGVSWMPDGRQLVFNSDHLGTSTLWRINRSGGDPEALSVAADNVGIPSIALHGHRLVFERFYVDTNLWKAPLSSMDQAAPIAVIVSTREDANPAFSPDGSRLAFASTRTGAFEIYISAADGSGPVQLTSMKTGDTGSPAWSPDGKQIAFDSRVNGQGDIYVISAEGGSPHRLTRGPYDSNMPSWSRDGLWLYYASSELGNPIWKVSPQGSEPVEVTKRGGAAPIESQDGKSLYYFRDGAVWKTDLNGEKETRVIDASIFSGWRLCGSQICVIQRTSARSAEFVRYDLVTGRKQSRQLDIGPPFGAAGGIDVSPDGRWVLYTRADSIVSDILMVENFR